ncbi:MAG: low-specificity L-threonine aldolase [Acidobacteriota bacterium]
MDSIDLRSDTVTRPSPAMREAMARAEVGDDVYAEDPTVRLLEERAAELMGHEAALFTPTGSMANMIGVALHCRPGDEFLIEERGHTINYELGGACVLAGAVPRPIATHDGLLTPHDVEAALPPDVYYFSKASLLLVENSHNLAGGRVLPLDVFSECVDVAHEQGLAVHLDGARLFNAALAAGVAPADFGSRVDTMMFCLSKGLGAPVGSVFCGSHDHVAEARRLRKRFGGGMRQVGVLAAAGLVALDEGPSALRLDHDRARRLAIGLSELDGVDLNPQLVETNIMVFRVPGREPHEVTAALAERGVLCAASSAEEVRWVTHRDLDDSQIDRALDVAAEVLGTAAE